MFKRRESNSRNSICSGKRKRVKSSVAEGRLTLFSCNSGGDALTAWADSEGVSVTQCYNVEGETCQ